MVQKQYLWRYGLGIFTAGSIGLCEEQQHLHLQTKLQVTPHYAGHDMQEAGLWCPEAVHSARNLGASSDHEQPARHPQQRR